MVQLYLFNYLVFLFCASVTATRFVTHFAFSGTDSKYHDVVFTRVTVGFYFTETCHKGKVMYF